MRLFSKALSGLALLVAAGAACIAFDRLTLGPERRYDSPMHVCQDFLDRANAGDDMHREDMNLLAQAIRECDRAIRMQPDWHPAYCKRASARLRTGNYDDALADLERADGCFAAHPGLSTNIPRSMIWADFANCCRHKGDAEQALAYIERYEAEEPGSLECTLWAGLCHRALGSRPAAQERAQTLRSGGSPMWRWQALVLEALLQLDDGSTDDAIASLRSASVEAEPCEGDARLRAWTDQVAARLEAEGVDVGRDELRALIDRAW